MTHVPYRGGGSVLADHLAGRIDVFINTTIVMVPHIRAGALRALAVTGPERGAELPEVPTFAELGVPGVIMAPWFGIVAPAATPAATVASLNAAFNDALRTASVAAKLREGGIAIGGGSAAGYGETMRREIARWAEIIRMHDIRPE